MLVKWTIIAVLSTIKNVKVCLVVVKPKKRVLFCSQVKYTSKSLPLIFELHMISTLSNNKTVKVESCRKCLYGVCESAQ